MMRHKPVKPPRQWMARWVLTMLFFAMSVSIAQSREVTDIFGKKVSVPDFPQKAYSTAPPITYMLYAIDPGMLAGLNFPVRKWEKQHLRKSMQALPVLGGWFGQGATPNMEMILKVSPEVIVTLNNDSAMKEKVYASMKTMPLPVVGLTLKSLADYPQAFLDLGRVLGRETRAVRLAAYSRSTLSEMSTLAAAIPDRKRVSVYYAEGTYGLSTECDTSEHTELIPLVGGQNVHRCKVRNPMGMEKISLEQVMLYNPEVILVLDPGFFKKIYADPRWQRIKAVKNRQVYLIPNQPFNWFDRPPSFMRLLGAKWLAHLLYPERYRINIVQEVRSFFNLFLDVDLSVQEAKAILQF